MSNLHLMKARVLQFEPACRQQILVVPPPGRTYPSLEIDHRRIVPPDPEMRFAVPMSITVSRALSVFT